MNDALRSAYEAIDQANAADPNRLDAGPRALVEGQRATAWVTELADAPSSEVLIAARAHHLTRWKVPRSSYPDGRAGYLRWRRDQKQRHADDIAELLAGPDYDTAFVERVQRLLRRGDLGQDPDTQLVEDAACLVFLETQFDDILARLDHDQVVAVLHKTLAKMSPAAIDAAGTIEVSAAGRAALAEASA